MRHLKCTTNTLWIFKKVVFYCMLYLQAQLVLFATFFQILSGWFALACKLKFSALNVNWTTKRSTPWIYSEQWAKLPSKKAFSHSTMGCSQVCLDLCIQSYTFLCMKKAKFISKRIGTQKMSLTVYRRNMCSSQQRFAKYWQVR